MKFSNGKWIRCALKIHQTICVSPCSPLSLSDVYTSLWAHFRALIQLLRILACAYIVQALNTHTQLAQTWAPNAFSLSHSVCCCFCMCRVGFAERIQYVSTQCISKLIQERDIFFSLLKPRSDSKKFKQRINIAPRVFASFAARQHFLR